MPAGPSPCPAPQGRPQEVYGAFAAFRQRRCRPHHAPEELAPEQAPSEAASAAAAGDGKGPGKAGSAAALVAAAGSGSGSASGSGSQLELLNRQAALADRLVLIGEVLHILRPVVYALALRR